MTQRSARPSWSTRTRALAVGGVCLCLAAAGCSGDSSSEADSPSPSTTTSDAPAPSPAAPTTSRETPRPPGAGLPDGLAAVINPLYGVGRVPASSAATAALEHRQVSDRQVRVKGTVGRFKDARVAVVTAGKDVTLAVKQGKSWRVVGGWWPSLRVKPVLGGDRRVLLIGSDARVSHGQRVDRSRADSLHIVGVDGKGGGGVLGIPRDSYVSLSTGGKNKINAAMVFGGPKAQLETVRRATRLPIEGYVLTGFGGFKKAIDAVGGLRIDVPKAVKGEASGADVEKGRQKLSGKEALAYARERKTLPDGDFGRSRNQGLVLLAGAGMVRLSGPRSLPTYLQKVGPHVETDLSPAQVLTLTATIFRMNPAKVRNEVAVGGFGTSAAGASIVVLGDTARRLFADLRDGNLS
ncbi:LCP family protein [Segeticoccus rhizosphaerae]|uniref:LCP family protein n=1 Tax=Segeticoccus rhizosphaerae TaxID=1104777 RepID=UPI0010C12BE4|nr:LCP family protein [Ornithinicoccus soli]